MGELTNGQAYSFEVRTVAGRRTSSAVSASATPVQPDTPGSISLSPNPPQAGGQMTATLSDADGSISRVLWSWTYFGATGSSDETGDETATGSAETATTATRTISILRTKVGYSIRVSASYTDGYGSGRRAQSAQSLPITAPPPVVCSLSSLSATAGNGQVSLSWSAPSGSNCATVTGYAYRYKTSGGSWSSWTSTGTATSQTVSGLTNGTTYSFEVHAVTGQGTSASVSASATPRAPPTDTPGSVSLSTTSPQAGSSITATLSDPDTPIGGLRWRWFITTASGTADEELVLEEAVEGANGSLSRTLSIGRSMVGRQLKARASYTDAFGSQTAESSYSSSVVAASGTVQAEAEEEPEETEPEETEPEETEIEETETEETETETAEGQAEGEQAEEPPAAKRTGSVALPDAGLAALAAPNPFNPHTTLHVQLPTSGPVRLTHTFHWDGRDQHGRPVPSGVYLYRLSTGQHVLVGKMALIR